MTKKSKKSPGSHSGGSLLANRSSSSPPMPSCNGITKSSATQCAHSTRPSTWPIFLLHFVLPMAILILMSNGNDMYNYITTNLIGDDPVTVSKGKMDDLTTKPTSLPTAPSMTTTYQNNEVDSATIEYKQKKESLKKQQQQQTSKSTNKGNKKTRPTGPKSSPLYKQMEEKIIQLRELYEKSHGTSSEYLTAIQYADYLKYRDATIHDGGTYQMEAIEVYTRAINLLEYIWRKKLANGEDVRLSTSSATAQGYEGLNRELFLDYADKSTEGMICAALSGLGKVYFMANMFDKAVQSYEQCLSYDHDYLDSLTYRAQSNLILGKYNDAGRDYKRVMEKDTDRIFLDSFTGLAKVLTAKEDAVEEGWEFLVKSLEIELPRLEEIHERIKLSPNNPGGSKHYADGLKRMHHTYFAYHDVKTKNASEAWTHLSKGNEYKLSTVDPFDAASEKERVLRVKQVFTPNFFPEGIGSQTRTPIFIIGFVRSGSTLLERILDAHPLIVGTGEDSVFNGRLDTIRNEIVKASMAGDSSVLFKKVKQLADDVVADMKSRWEVIDANMHNEDGDDEEDKEERPYPTRFADKMLTNYYNVGFIHLLFPNALILHVAREPMDTLLSAFKHDFPPGGLDYTSEFPGLAQLYHGYRDVMEHWDTVLPGRVTHIRYEDLVTDLPNLAPRIIDVAGVPWDPSVLDFHKKKQAVNTLSTTQVRKGVYSHHFKGWKRYEEYLEPLIKRVGKRVKYDLKTTVSRYTKTTNARRQDGGEDKPSEL